MDATQLGATGGARPVGAFSAAGARRLRAFLHYSLSHSPAKHDCGLLTINYAKKLQLLGTFVTRFCGSQVAESIGKAGSINNFQCLWANLVLCPPTFFEAEDFVY